MEMARRGCGESREEAEVTVHRSDSSSEGTPPGVFKLGVTRARHTLFCSTFPSSLISCFPPFGFGLLPIFQRTYPENLS